jgi:hypothetical protein
MTGRELMRLELLPNDYGRAGKQKKKKMFHQQQVIKK